MAPQCLHTPVRVHWAGAVALLCGVATLLAPLPANAQSPVVPLAPFPNASSLVFYLQSGALTPTTGTNYMRNWTDLSVRGTAGLIGVSL